MPHSSVATPPNVREDVCVRRKGPPASEEELESAGMPSATGDESGMNIFASAPQLGGLVNVRGSGGPRSLAPRTESDPIPVFLGRAPGSASAPLAANASKAVKPPITATAYAGGKGEGEETDSPILGSASGPLALKPANNVSMRGASVPALKAAPLKTAKAAPGPVPPIAAKTSATPAAKASAKPAGQAAGSAKGSVTVKTPATVKPATASALGAKPPTAGKPMVLIIDPKSPGSKPVAASPPAKKPAPVPPAKTTPKP
jgi:D-alanyl-D-alanine carboxypeptidase